MFKEILILCLITILPLIELRLAIPVGILTGTLHLPYNISLSGLGLNPVLVLGLVIVMNILLGMFLFNFLLIFDERLKKTRIGKHYIRMLERSQRKISKKVEKYGVFGLSLFIGLPIPGSGVYMGSLGGFIIGMKKRDFYIANTLGVIIAATLVTILTLLGKSFF